MWYALLLGHNFSLAKWKSGFSPQALASPQSSIRIRPECCVRGSKPVLSTAVRERCPPAIDVPLPPQLLSPQNGPVRCNRRTTLDEFCFEESSSPSRSKDFRFGELQDLQSQNHLLRVHLQNKDKALQAILKPALRKPNNRNELEALLDRDTQFLLKLRQHNSDFRREAESNVGEIATIAPSDPRLELAKYQSWIAEYHIEKMELCERMEKQLENIQKLTAQNQQFTRMFERLGGAEWGIASLNELEDKINDLIAENSQSLLELNEVKRENMKLRTGCDQLKKTLNLTNRELERMDKQYRQVAKKLQDIQQKHQEPQSQKPSQTPLRHSNSKGRRNRLVSQIITFTLSKQFIHQQPKSLQHLQLLPHIQTRNCTDESRPLEMMSGSLFSFGLDEPSLVLLAEHNELRQKYVSEIRETIGKYLKLQDSKLSQMLLDFCQNLFYYPNHSELTEFLSSYCAGLKFYEQYEVHSLKTLVNLFKERAEGMVGSGDTDSDNMKEENHHQVNTSLTDDL